MITVKLKFDVVYDLVQDTRYFGDTLRSYASSVTELRNMEDVDTDDLYLYVDVKMYESLVKNSRV